MASRDSGISNVSPSPMGWRCSDAVRRPISDSRQAIFSRAVLRPSSIIHSRATSSSSSDMVSRRWPTWGVVATRSSKGLRLKQQSVTFWIASTS